MAAHPLVPTSGSEDFAEPVAAQLWIYFAIDNHRSSALVKPGSQALQIRHVANRDPLRAHGRRDGRKVVVSEESPVSWQADVFKQMHFSSIGRIVDDDDERRKFITHKSL